MRVRSFRIHTRLQGYPLHYANVSLLSRILSIVDSIPYSLDLNKSLNSFKSLGLTRVRAEIKKDILSMLPVEESEIQNKLIN